MLRDSWETVPKVRPGLEAGASRGAWSAGLPLCVQRPEERPPGTFGAQCGVAVKEGGKGVLGGTRGQEPVTGGLVIQAESPELHPKSSRESLGSEQQRDKARPEFSKRLFWLRMENGPGEPDGSS